VVSTLNEVKTILKSTLGLGAETDVYDADTALLGNIPEFDSMAVVSVITALEENYDIVVEDDEIDAEVFETIGSLARFVDEKLD